MSDPNVHFASAAEAHPFSGTFAAQAHELHRRAERILNRSPADADGLAIASAASSLTIAVHEMDRLFRMALDALRSTPNAPIFIRSPEDTTR